MSGKMSRRKGSRVEYIVRDMLRTEGFEADRVPASGAAQGFKGDIWATAQDGQQYVVEVKARKEGFKVLYAYFRANRGESISIGVAFHHPTHGTILVRMGTTFSSLLERDRRYELIEPRDNIRLTSKFVSCMNMLKECDTLAIKDNGQDVLFMRFDKI